MPIAAIVFDFDGVIANSEPLHLRAFQAVLAEAGITVERDEYYDRYLGFDDAGAFRAIGEARGRHWTESELTALVARKAVVFDSAIESTAVLFPTAAACIERLAARYPLGIASGALRHEIEAVLQGAGLAQHIRFIVASGETPRSKPAPDPYRRAAELHGLPPAACLAIEDSRWGIESARSAGLRCVGVTHSYPAGELASADLVVDSLDQLTPEMIERRWATG